MNPNNGNLGKAIALQGLMATAIFSPGTLLFAGGMYLAGKLAGAYLECAVHNAEVRRNEGYGGGPLDEDTLAAGHLGASFVRTFSPFCPILPVVAIAAGADLNRRSRNWRPYIPMK